MTRQPIAANQVPEKWCHAAREVIVREGLACRPWNSAIQIKSTRTNNWHTVMLPTDALSFVSEQERDQIYRKLVGIDPIVLHDEKPSEDNVGGAGGEQAGSNSGSSEKAHQ